VRAKVEHVFRVMKCQFGYRKVRYRGIAKSLQAVIHGFGQGVLGRECSVLLAQPLFEIVDERLRSLAAARR
jgi:hypothetical protein